MATRWAVLSDVHGNLEALEAVLADAEAQKVDKIAVLGDVIDYGPDPVACLSRVSAAAEVWLVGNHEEEAVVASGEQEESGVLAWSQPLLAESPVWQAVRKKIEADGAPAHASQIHGAIHFVHASAARPTIQYVWPAHEIQYVVFNHHIDDRLTQFLGEFQTDHGFNGHTHVPAMLTRYAHRNVLDPYEGCRRHHVHTFVGPNAIFFVPEAPCTVREIGAVKMAVNVGSVGQPRRLGDNRASYVIYDGSDLAFRRVDYEWMRTASKLAKLPIDDEEKRQLIERLETGI
ncbi:MAG TPA: metallophosphoesterase family protein [Kofleriaceae bacterium]|jgi:predicted phosphodiesterase|nr:metallophosphoesterase family protein [Kofleriaceae bacterium]